MTSPLAVTLLPARRNSGGTLEIGLSLDDETGSRQVRFCLTGEGLEPSDLEAEAATALALIPAMRMGRDLQVAGSTTPEWSGQTDRFQEVFSCWYPEFQRVAVSRAGDRPGPSRRSPAPGVGLFLSGGVDSFYSLLKHRHEITHAIFVHGCDIPLHRLAQRTMVSARLLAACRDFGISMIEIETDLLKFSDPLAHWGFHYHGSALAGMAMMLSRTLGRVYIGSTAMWRDLAPWGSHPITDPLWSSPQLDVRHDGTECRRAEKIQLLAGDETCLRHLRVCWENEEGRYNCGRCEKCLRTMTGLRLAGALDRCPAFDQPLDLDHLVSTVTFARGGHHWRDLLARAEASGRDPDLVAALREVCRLNGYAEQAKALGRDNQGLLASPDWLKLLPKIRNKLFRNLAGHDAGWFRETIAASAPQAREEVFQQLWRADHRWLRARLRQAEREHRAQRLRRWLPRRAAPPPHQS